MSTAEFHTAGPWEYHAQYASWGPSDGDRAVAFYRVRAINSGAYIASVGVGAGAPEEAEPTARIIAAAPSMLAALRVVQDYLTPRAFNDRAASAVLQVVEGAIVEAVTSYRRADVEDVA